MENLVATRTQATSAIRLACRACEKTFATNPMLYQHERRVHGICHKNKGKEFMIDALLKWRFISLTH